MQLVTFEITGFLRNYYAGALSFFIIGVDGFLKILSVRLKELK